MEALRLADNQEASSWGRDGDESEEVEVSCKDDVSRLCPQDVRRIVDHYGMEVVIVIPSESCKVHHLDPRYVMISEAYLKFGVRFPLNSFLVDVLNIFGLTVF